MANSLTNAAQNASAYSAPPKKDCKFCGKDGLLILPLRCGTLPKEASAPALPGNVCQHVKGIPITLSTYTLRMGRVGYLYVLVNRKGTLSWQCYIGTATGYWAQFAADAPPLEPPEFSCEPNTCGLNASMIAIHEAIDVKTAYFLFTPSPLTVNMLSEAQLKSTAAAEKLCAKGQMTKMSPAAWVEGTYAQTDCLKATELADGVTEFALAKMTYPTRSPLANVAINATFPLMGDGTAADTKQGVLAVAMDHLVRLPALKTYMVNKKAAAVAMYDHLGVTQELNDLRNDAYNKVEDFLNHADNDKVTNRWKFDSLQAVREVQVGFENGIVSNSQKYHADQELHIHARHEPSFPDDSETMERYKNFPGRISEIYKNGREAWRTQYPDKAAALDAEVAKHRAALPERVRKAQAAAKTHWEKKYASLLDRDAIRDLDAAFDAAGQDALKLAEVRVADHLGWVQHDRLIDALDVYDRKDIISGHYLSHEVAAAVMGMTNSEKSAAKVDEWLAVGNIQRKNIYMRGLLLNQDDLEKEAIAALNAAAAEAAKAEKPALVSGEQMRKILKGMIDMYRKADSAWDEFLRNQGQVSHKDAQGKVKTNAFGQPKQPFHQRWEGQKLFQMSEMNRRVARMGITKLEMKVVGYLGGFVYARMGKVAERLLFEELMYGICPEKPNAPKDSKVKVAGKGEVRPEGTVYYDRDGKYMPTTDSTRHAPIESPKDAEIRRQQVAIMHRQAVAEMEAARGVLLTDAEKMHLERVQGVKYTIEEYVKDPKTNNYHQARLGVLLGVVETIGLVGKLNDIRNGKGNEILYWETLANLASIGSIGYDIAYALAKSTREQAQAVKNGIAAVAGAGDIVRGGFKMWAGAFGAAAGFATILVDLTKFQQEVQGDNRTDRKAILAVRMFYSGTSTLVGATTAFSYSGPMLRRLAIRLGSGSVNRGVVALAKGAEWLGVRVGLLRLGAFVSGVGLALLVAEVAYYAVEEFFLWLKPNTLEIWCMRSAMRLRTKGGNAYVTLDFEVKELAKAQALVMAKP